MSDFKPFIELTKDTKVVPTEADLSIEANSYTWVVPLEKLCHYSEFFKLACVPGRFQEGRDRRITIREAKPWMVARVIQWCYSQTFDHVCTDKSPFERPGCDLPQILQQVTDREEYALDHEEDSLLPTYAVSAEVYQLAHRFFMPELCKYIATEMLDRYRRLIFTSWPSAVFDTLAQASTDDTDFRVTLCEALATRTFLESSSWYTSLRLKGLMDDDPEFIFELMRQKDCLNQRYRDRVKRLMMAGTPEHFKMMELELEFSGQDTLSNLRPRGLSGEKSLTWRWGHFCGGVPVLNIVSDKIYSWNGSRWILRTFCATLVQCKTSTVSREVRWRPNSASRIVENSSTVYTSSFMFYQNDDLININAPKAEVLRQRKTLIVVCQSIQIRVPASIMKTTPLHINFLHSRD